MLHRTRTLAHIHTHICDEYIGTNNGAVFFLARAIRNARLLVRGESHSLFVSGSVPTEITVGVSMGASIEGALIKQNGVNRADGKCVNDK